jgi:hypothetical protein
MKGSSLRRRIQQKEMHYQQALTLLQSRLVQ